MAKKLGKALKIREGTQLIACIGDEDTVSGFLLTGIGERNPRGETNFLIVDQNTPKDEIEEAFKRFVSRQDIAIILIAEKDIRHLIEAHTEVIPTVLEIPSKDFPYQPDKDMVLQRAAKMLFGNDTSKISQYIKIEEDF